MITQILKGVFFFQGQAMVIVGVTGPVSIFLDTVFSITKALDVPFLPFVSWVCIWYNRKFEKERKKKRLSTHQNGLRTFRIFFFFCKEWIDAFAFGFF